MNILIIKTGALGDVLRNSFIAQALKDKYKGKNPEIFWLTDGRAVPLLSNNPYISEIIVSENKRKLKELTFDLVINLEEDLENAKFSVSLKTKKLIGVYINKENKIDYSPECSYWFDMSIISKLGKNKADKLKKKNKKNQRHIIGEMLGLNWNKYEPFLRLNQRQRNFTRDFMKRYNLKRTDLIIGINTGSADRWPKALPVKKTAALIDRVYDKYKAKILLFGGPNEIERNKEIQRYTKSPVIDTGCGNDLFQFPALVSSCSLFITTDSLGLHVALALKRKTIALIGPTSSSEIDMYELGEKIAAKSKCVCCYKRDCKSMDKLDLNNIINSMEKLLGQKITLLITAFKEPKIDKALEAAINQNTRYKYNIIVSAPDNETLNIAKEYANKNKRIKIFKDPGKGKSYAINKVLENVDTDILILTDGDVIISNNAVEDISNLFLNPEIGCVSGRPYPIEKRNNKYGYWANFLFEAAHRLRKIGFENNSFVECSAYLFAFRKNKIKSIPLNVAEDAVIPYYFWEMGYKIGYADNALVFVKNVDNWNDWVRQKVRTSKAHETLSKYVNTETTRRVKSFSNEASGITWLFNYPYSLKELFWSIELAFARLYMWGIVYLETKIANSQYNDAWERIESAR